MKFTVSCLLTGFCKNFWSALKTLLELKRFQEFFFTIRFHRSFGNLPLKWENLVDLFMYLLYVRRQEVSGAAAALRSCPEFTWGEAAFLLFMLLETKFPSEKASHRNTSGINNYDPEIPKPIVYCRETARGRRPPCRPERVSPPEPSGSPRQACAPRGLRGGVAAPRK